jgi:hypothetical protein
MRKRTFITAAALLALSVAVAAPLAKAADPAAARQAILKRLQAQNAGKPFSAERGKAFFLGKHTGGKPKINSCTVCHTKNPRAHGRTRTGKVIKPMAVSANPQRFTDPRKVAKWFRRNCRTVLGRECTAQEKGDFITFMMSQ